MRTRIVAALTVLLLAGPAWSQAVLAPAMQTPPDGGGPAGLPPLPVAGLEGYPGGPQQLARPVDSPSPAPPQPVAEFSAPESADADGSGPLGREWQRMEYLLWWIKNSRIPALVSSNRAGGTPSLDNSATSVLVGDRFDNLDRSGGRFTVGLALDADQTVGLEGNYFFLGTRTTTRSGGGTGAAGTASIGVPYFDASTQTEQAQVVAMPGFASGTVDVSASTRMQGTELNGVLNLLSGAGCQLDALVGFRYLELDEGLQIAYVSSRPQTGGDVLTLGSADQFDGHNRFFGGQLGLRANFSKGPLFLDLSGKLALGDTIEVVRINGVSRSSDPVTGVTLTQGGLFAVATNSGRYSRGAFAIAPEGTVRLGVDLNKTRLFVGYNFLYLSAVARPGDQIDRNVNASLVPLSTRSGTVFGPPLPAFAFQSSDFWAQGLMFGVEYRY